MNNLSKYKRVGKTIRKIKDYRFKFHEYIDNELSSSSFVSCSKDGRMESFSRERKLSLRRLLFFIMSFKTAVQRDLDRLYAKLLDRDFNIREVSKGALTQARAKLNPWAFQRLNEVASDAFYLEVPYYYTWHNRRLLAVDGSRLTLPSHPSIEEEFGVHSFGPKADSPKSLALCSLLYDVLNCVTLDAQLAPYADSERSLLLKHLDRIKAGDLLLLDRGYPSYALLFLLKGKGIEFCIRLRENWWKEAKVLIDEDLDDKIVEFTLPDKDVANLAESLSDVPEKLSFRLVKVKLENGEYEILCTSLLDTVEHPAEEFSELYHLRWNQEEAYKLLKARVEVERFSGKTARAVQQDFYAKIFVMTLCAVYAHPIEEKVTMEYKQGQHRKHRQKINRTHALASFIDMLVPMFLKTKYRQTIRALDQLIAKTREIVRPGRNQKRNKHPKKTHYMNYKPL